MDLAPWFGGGLLLAAFLYIPLSAWAATGSWVRAWEAARQYLKIMAGFVVVGGGFGLLMALSTYGPAALWAMVTGH
jgi:hypothetical protein